MAVVAVIDTSSLLWITDHEPKQNIPEEAHAGVFSALAGMVASGLLTYPREVRDELIKGDPDLPRLWARENLDKRMFVDPPLAIVKEVLAVASSVLATVTVTPKKDDADPYVVAQAIHIMDFEQEVIVVTEDKRRRGGKMPVTEACGLLDVTLPAHR